MIKPPLGIWTFLDLLLAFAPIALAAYAAPATRLALLRGGARRWAIALALLLVWVIFLPNTAYLLTEWRHYSNRVEANPAYHMIFHGRGCPANAAPGFTVLTLFYLIYTGAGLVTLWLAVLPLDRQAIGLLGARAQIVTRASIFLLCAVGVYMGFVLKLNSWQILRLETLVSLGRGLATLATYPLLWTLIVAGAGVLWASYAVFVKSLPGWEKTLPPQEYPAL